MKQKVIITGVTGFLGSHIAELLINNEFELAGLIRSKSNKWRCFNFTHRIKWINSDNLDWVEKVIAFSPDVIIHCAWDGVASSYRDDFLQQSGNLILHNQLLQVCKNLNSPQFICLGSQAEYGYYTSIISEDYTGSPNSYYGHFKMECLRTTKFFCESNSIKWHWLRLFPIFGEKEDSNWFIPQVTQKALNSHTIDMTPGEQKYAYLYVRDFAKIIAHFISSPPTSGVYNISSSNLISLKSLVALIVDITKSKSIINLGAYPYRPNQSMIVAGQNQKLKNVVGAEFETSFEKNLQYTVEYIKRAVK